VFFLFGRKVSGIREFLDRTVTNGNERLKKHCSAPSFTGIIKKWDKERMEQCSHAEAKEGKTVSSERVYKMKVSDVYPMLVQKAERKGRTRAEVDTVTMWLTGYDEQGLQSQLDKEVSYERFFAEAPQINPNANKIKGVICGHRVEAITDPLMQNVRRLDKLIDELAKGKAMEKILRSDNVDEPGPFYHGTKADLAIGCLLDVGHNSNYGKRKQANFLYFTATMDAAIWGAELAVGEGRGRIYIVEPLGSYGDDPNLTDKKFPGNPTKSYRTQKPLRIIGEVGDWQGHSADVLQNMLKNLEELERRGIEAING
jgi:rifampin ADP-ribosylating transferase